MARYGQVPGSEAEEREEGRVPGLESDTDLAADSNEISTDEIRTAVAESAAEAEPSFTFGRRRIALTLAAVVVLIGAIYFLLPKIVGIRGTLASLGDAEPAWIAVAFGMDVLAYFAYVALFRGTVGHVIKLNWRESYQITMAGLGASLLFSAGGAGGVVLTYWALRKAGMPTRRAACRMVAFLVLLYAVYLGTVVVAGILLRTGLLHGPNPAGLTVVPVAIAGAVIAIFLAIALIPGDFERRFTAASSESRPGRLAQRLATVPATLAMGVRTAIGFVRNPSTGGLAVVGAVGYWAANVGILWASFHGYGVSVPLGVVVMGFFIGLAANLIPFAPAGVGAVDAGMIGTFVLFGYHGAEVFPAILTYRLFAFWLPIPPGIVAFFQLRRTVARWEGGTRPAARTRAVTAEA
jgi:uncharacterized protein (TIRG00374 family)